MHRCRLRAGLSTKGERIAAMRSARTSIFSSRAGRAEAMAKLVLFLASDRAGFIGGTAVDIDGGLSVYRADA